MATDYVSGVVGIFIIFVVGLWIAKKGKYHGPVRASDALFVSWGCLTSEQEFDLILGQEGMTPGSGSSNESIPGMPVHVTDDEKGTQSQHDEIRIA